MLSFFQHCFHAASDKPWMDFPTACCEGSICGDIPLPLFCVTNKALHLLTSWDVISIIRSTRAQDIPADSLIAGTHANLPASQVSSTRSNRADMASSRPLTP